jgi:hypothetical protein
MGIPCPAKGPPPPSRSPRESGPVLFCRRWLMSGPGRPPGRPLRAWRAPAAGQPGSVDEW